MLLENKRLVWEDMQQDEDSFDGAVMERPRKNPEIMAHAVHSMEDKLDNAAGSKLEKELHKEYDAFFEVFEDYKEHNYVDQYEEEYEAQIKAKEDAFLKKNPKANYKSFISRAKSIVKLKNMAEEEGSSRMKNIVNKYITGVRAKEPVLGSFIRDLTWYADTTKNKNLREATVELLRKLFDYTMKEQPDLMVKLQDRTSKKSTIS